MNESENLLIISLSQMGVVNSEVKSLMGITNEEFSRILLKLCQKIVNLKGMNIILPENINRDLNMKYKECQKLVDFMKQIGFKQDLNINNVLFPSIRDMQRLFEYLLEYITNIDTGLHEYGQNFSEKNVAKLKLARQLSNWTKETWLLPELVEERKEDKPMPFVKMENIKLIKRRISNNFTVAENSTIKYKSSHEHIK
jgi:hypothetical protein